MVPAPSEKNTKRTTTGAIKARPNQNNHLRSQKPKNSDHLAEPDPNLPALRAQAESDIRIRCGDEVKASSSVVGTTPS